MAKTRGKGTQEQTEADEGEKYRSTTYGFAVGKNLRLDTGQSLTSEPSSPSSSFSSSSSFCSSVDLSLLAAALSEAPSKLSSSFLLLRSGRRGIEGKADKGTETRNEASFRKKNYNYCIIHGIQRSRHRSDPTKQFVA